MASHHFSNPNSYVRPYEDLAREQWRYVDYETMDEAFVRAMQAAGYVITAPSTVAGTKAPRLGYQRPDSLQRP